MKSNTREIRFSVVVLFLLLSRFANASFFEMTLQDNSIYTPGSMNLALKPADTITVQGKYSFKISVFVDGALVRRMVLSTSRGSVTAFELEFPEVHNRTVARCRAELFVDKQFVEAIEKPLILHPSLTPVEKQPQNKKIWVFDTSGALQDIFNDLQILAGDATFQAVRDFQKADILFVGEKIEDTSWDILEDGILGVKTKPRTLILLNQKKFPQGWPVKVTKGEKMAANVVCDPNHPLMFGLTKLDVMNMLQGAVSVEIANTNSNTVQLNSCIDEHSNYKKQTRSYLTTAKNKKLTVIYCQIPIIETFGSDPRSAILLGNILRFAYTLDSTENRNYSITP